MPQDSARSSFYRSFVTCDDPSGVVQCTTIKRSKTGSLRMEGDVETQKNSVRKNNSLKGLVNELGRSSTVQLREVPGGVQQLSKVVDSLPKGNFDRQSEDIAKDLLRGALNLQESLVMLRKLQEEAPKYKTSNTKQKEKAGSDKHDQNIFRRSYSERFGDHTNVMEFQKPRLSADGFSRDCYEELREVICESFARQNILPKSSSKEKARFDRKFDFSTDIASASSSQSSIFTSNDFASSGSSLSNLQPEKPKASNLIARLMGLEESPSKQLENRRLLYNKRPIFDIDLLNPRKPGVIVQKEEPVQRTFGQIIELMQFKGLTKKKYLDGSKQKMHHYNVSDFSDDTPPIVLIKPQEKELLCINKCSCGRKASNADERLKLWRINERVAPKKLNPPERYLNSSEIPRKVREDKSAVKRSSREKEKESKFQASVPVKPQKGEAIENGVVKIQGVAPSTSKAVEETQITEPNLKTYIVSKPNNKGRINSTTLGSSRGSIVSKKQAAAPKISTPVSNSISKTKRILPGSGNQKKKPSAVVVDSKRHEDVDAELDVKFENKDKMVEMRITPSEQLSCEELRDASDHSYTDESNTPRESTGMIVQPNCDLIHKGSDTIVNTNQTTITNDVRDILLSSENFLNHAEELFDTPSVKHITLEGTADAKLILDCANELLECKCEQWGLTIYPLLQHPCMRSKISISFRHLVAKIYEGIYKLRTYSKLGGEPLVIDTVYDVLKRDLSRKGVVTGAWDLGWSKGFSFDEVDRVVVDIERVLLRGIVEDLLSDLSMLL